jgi:high-affinity iron transporter
MAKTAKIFCLFLCLISFINVTSVYGAEPSTENQLKQANEYIVKAIELAKNNDVEGAKVQFELYKKQWFTIEEGIKGKSITSYKDIEDVMGRIAFALLQNPVQPKSLIQGLTDQANINQRFIDGKYAADDKSANHPSGNLTAVISLLKDANQYIKQGKIKEAKASIEHFRGSWLDVEGIILTQSAKAYSDTERDMVLSYSYLSSSPPNTDKAKHTLDAMIGYLEPLTVKTSYNMLDAVTILLREGLEALLVVVALIAFLKKSGHEDKKKWIWSGVSTGIAISIVIGVIVQVLFSSGAFGNNNFMISGFTGLFAAVMLLYMTYWLHSNASITQWNHYINNRSTKALAKGSLWSLAILAFLAVFREGTETVLFLIGMASSISIIDLLAGIGIAIAILLIVSYLVLRVGVKIPIRPFFLVSSVLVFYLCFKFTGMGVHGLQIAGLLPATDLNGLTTIDALAFYPTWEGIIPQGMLIIAAVGIVIWNKVKDLRLQKLLEIKNA